MHKTLLSELLAPPRSRLTRALLALVLLAGLAGGFALVRGRIRPAASAVVEAVDPALPPGGVELPEAAQRNAGVEILPVRSATLPVTIEVTGVVAPDEARVAHIRPLARGLIEDVRVRLGARVAAGQALVVYDNIALGELIGEYLSERAALRQAEADRDVRERMLQRAEELIKPEAIAQQTLDLRRAVFQNARAAVDSQKARVARIVSRTATRFERRDVQTGTTAGDLVELVAGVRPGDKVVGHGSFYLKTALLRERIGEGE